MINRSFHRLWQIRFATTKVVAAGLAVGLLVFSCKPPGTSHTAAIATTSSAKTGMFIPESSDNNLAIVNAAAAPMTVAAIATKLGIKLNVGSGLTYTAARTADGDQLIIRQIGTSFPMPMCGLDKAGKPLIFVGAMLPIGTSGAAFSQSFLRAHSGDKPAITVSIDGNQSNLYMVRQVHNQIGYSESFLISYLYVLDSASHRRLLKVGNDLIDEPTGEAVLEFVEVGTNVWRVNGIYDDQYMTLGSLVWSSDSQTYYSQKSKTEPIYVWHKQDLNSMAVVGPAPASVVAPALVQKMIEPAPTAVTVRSVQHFGPQIGLVTNGATSLVFNGAKAGAGALGLTGPGKLHGRPTLFAQFGASQAEGLSLAGSAVTLQPNMVYSKPGQAINFNVGGQSYTGSVVQAGSSSKAPDGWFTTGATSSTNYVGMGSKIAKVTTYNDGSPQDVTFLNQADAQNMLGAAQTASAQAPALQEQFQAQTANAQQYAKISEKMSNNFLNDYGTPTGIAANVVVPIVANGAGQKLGGVIEKSVGPSGGAILGNMTSDALAVGADVTQAQLNGAADTATTKGQIVGDSIHLGANIITGHAASSALGGVVNAAIDASDSNSAAEFTNDAAGGIGAIAQAAVPIPGVGVATTVALRGTATVGANLQTANAFDNANSTADAITNLRNSTQTAQGLNGYFGSQASSSPSSSASDPSSAAPSGSASAPAATTDTTVADSAPSGSPDTSVSSPSGTPPDTEAGDGGGDDEGGDGGDEGED